MKFIIRKKSPLVLLAFFFGSLLLAKILGVTLNITPSMPEGIYIKARGEIHRGDIVAACLVGFYKTVGLDNRYLEKGSRCNGADPVIKRVIAVPGDDVVLQDDYIQVNGTKLSLHTYKKDSRGRKLSCYPRAAYLKTKRYWLIGTHAPNSWDSRYWGPVDKKQILYKLHAIMN